MKEQDRIWTLMARKLAGEATEKELEELQELLKKYPEAGYSLQVLSDLWRTDHLWRTDQKKNEDEAEHAFDLHLIRMEQRDSPPADDPHRTHSAAWIATSASAPPAMPAATPAARKRP